MNRNEEKRTVLLLNDTQEQKPLSTMPPEMLVERRVIAFSVPQSCCAERAQAPVAAQRQTFSVLLRQHRMEAGLTQETLAERAGVSYDTIYALESGKTRGPQRKTVDLLAEALRLTQEQRSLFEAVAERGRVRPGTESTGNRERSSPPPSELECPSRAPYGENREEIPLFVDFCERGEFIASLKSWVGHDRRHVYGVPIRGVLDSTAFAARFGGQAGDKPEKISYCSIPTSPALGRLQEEAIHLLAEQRHIDLPGDPDSQLLLLIQLLREYRCLIILGFP